MRTYAQIKELKGFENDRVEMVLRYIAENYDKKHSYISSDNTIQYGRMYYDFLGCRFIRAAQNPIFQNRRIQISRRQYNRIRKYRGGRVTINTAVFLLALYEIMIDIYKKIKIGPNLEPRINDITYTEYMVGVLLQHIRIILNPINNALTYIDPDDYNVFETIYRECREVDNIACNNPFKIYNNNF